MSSPLFSVEHLSKRFGDNLVVDDLSFAIAPGECLGVIGPNGAGRARWRQHPCPGLADAA